MPLRINAEAPNFMAETTDGTIISMTGRDGAASLGAC
jgi:hypothetical protein